MFNVVGRFKDENPNMVYFCIQEEFNSTQLENLCVPQFVFLSVMYIPDSLYLVNSPIYLNCPHELFTY